MKVAQALATLALVAACGGRAATAPDPRYPARPPGCDVKIFHDAPTTSTDNIGPVWARCNPDVADADCLRTLEDQACKLGADILWGVPEQPSKHDGKNEWNGRAAHTRTITGVTPEK